MVLGDESKCQRCAAFAFATELRELAQRHQVSAATSTNAQPGAAQRMRARSESAQRNRLGLDVSLRSRLGRIPAGSVWSRLMAAWSAAAAGIDCLRSRE